MNHDPLIGSLALLAYLIFSEHQRRSIARVFSLTLLMEPQNVGWKGSPPGTINTWDLLKKAFIQTYCPPSMTAKQLEDIHNFKQEGDESLYQAWERYNDLIYKCLLHDINRSSKVNSFYKGLSTMNRQLLDSQRPILKKRSSNDGLAALINKLDNLGRDMKKLKESVHAIQVRCQICEGPHLDKDCSLNKEVKQVEEIDNCPPYAERRQSLEELLAKHQEESARRSTKMEVWIKKLQENAEINTRNQDASLKNLETQIEQLTKEFCSMKEKSEQAKVVTVENEGSSSPKKLKNLHGISFLSDSQEKNTIDQLPTKEANPGHFTLPCTISNFNFYAMANLGASVNVLPRNIYKYLDKKP
ncbi:cysteine-rich receptor-like protein kinase [Tanacetum coccineum]|uniref:Cysteine-rich receptor-like protein kinase n=1 Tax=Tanacetum coccineum TaxID=301880 RepID=A0ABQ4WGZ5_9ASTR